MIENIKFLQNAYFHVTKQSTRGKTSFLAERLQMVEKVAV